MRTNNNTKEKNWGVYSRTYIRNLIYKYNKTKTPLPEGLIKMANKYGIIWRDSTQESAKKDLTIYTDNHLRGLIKKYTTKNIPLPDDINAEAARRFRTWDPESKRFKNARPKTLADYSDTHFRKIIRTIRAKGEGIPDDINAEAARRFPTWDKATRDYRDIRNRPSGQKPLYTYSNTHIQTLIQTTRESGAEISDDLNYEAVRRFKSWNPDKKRFERKTYKKWALYKNITIRNKFRQLYKHGQDIPDDLNQELARRFENYDPATRTFKHVAPGGRPPKVSKPAICPPKEFDPYEILTRQNNKETVVNQLKSFDIKPDDATVLSAAVAHVKGRHGIIYNDIIINGRAILTGHKDTVLRSFMNGKFLGVYGVWTLDPQWPTTPQWIVYDTELNPRPSICAQYTNDGKRPYIISVAETPTCVVASTNNRCKLEMHTKKVTNRLFQLTAERVK